MTSSESNDSNAVEVDSIRFETLVPERVLTINRYGAKTPVQFGICVTNMSANPYRFIFFGLMPELQDADGRAIQRSYAMKVSHAAGRMSFCNC